MLREVSLEEISDGKLYGYQDMVRADCLGCKGCSKCCETMADTILLTPLDVFRLTQATGRSFDQLLEKEIELNVQNGLILPNIRMTEGRGCCSFLDEEGWCSIHESRPDLCRLFPLGRYYENGDFSYFLQTLECDHPKAKVKVKKWIDIPDYEENRQYVLAWHDLTSEIQRLLENAGETQKSQLLTAFLQVFYRRPYEPGEDFYPQFAKRLETWKNAFA